MAKAKPKAKPAPTPAATHFVVERFNWRRCGDTTFHRLPGFTRIRSFDTRAEAEAFKHTEEAKARAVVNPFLGTLAPPTDQTDLPEHALCDWYMDHDFDPPKPDKKGHLDWAKWWEKESKKWKGERRAVAWEPLHKVQFYRICERPKVPVGYALVRLNWGYNDEWFYPDPEGGTVFEVYRNRAKALEECEGFNDVGQDLWHEDASEHGFEEAGANQFELNDRVLPGASPFDPPPKPKPPKPGDEREDFGTFTAHEVPFWEVIEIELEGLE
jgi:hypothetical protein